MLDSITSINLQFLLEPYGSLLNGMIWGIPLKSSPEFFLSLKRTGLLHLVVLSGTNVNLILAYSFVLTSMFSKRLSILISLLILFIFIALVPKEAPIIRATIMGLLTSVALIFGRQIAVVYSLFLTALVMILFDFSLLSQISFQLSFAATLGVILASLVKKKFNSKLIEYLYENIKITFCTQLITFPIIFYHFKQISLIAPIANLLVGWIIEPILLIGLVGDIAGLIYRPLAFIPMIFAQGLLIYFVSVVYFLSNLTFGFLDFSK